jgi:effector-binding domain-containing protein
MSLQASGITYKETEETLVASIRFGLEKRAELKPKFEELTQHCEEHICGPAFVIYHWGTGIAATFDVEAGFPVRQAVESDGIKSRVLESEKVLSLVHKGSHETLRESARKLYNYATEYGINPGLRQREIYLQTDDEHPEENETELQVILHSWNDLLAAGLEQVLGPEVRDKVMQGSEQITVESSVGAKVQWTCAAMDRLDQLAHEGQRYDAVSRCAHVFPQERIQKLRAIYAQNQDVDQVLAVMSEDTFWYEEPVREGNVLYVKKNPFDPEGYAKAETEAEKKKCYCHCSLIKNHLGEMNVTFCHCGAGWYRQLWEGILEKPVRVDMLKTLVKGDDVCQFAVHLPI